jgi:hypothetical protein
MNSSGIMLTPQCNVCNVNSKAEPWCDVGEKVGPPHSEIPQRAKGVHSGWSKQG